MLVLCLCLLATLLLSMTLAVARSIELPSVKAGEPLSAASDHWLNCLRTVRVDDITPNSQEIVLRLNKPIAAANVESSIVRLERALRRTLDQHTSTSGLAVASVVIANPGEVTPERSPVQRDLPQIFAAIRKGAEELGIQDAVISAYILFLGPLVYRSIVIHGANQPHDWEAFRALRESLNSEFQVNIRLSEENARIRPVKASSSPIDPESISAMTASYYSQGLGESLPPELIARVKDRRGILYSSLDAAEGQRPEDIFHLSKGKFEEIDSRLAIPVAIGPSAYFKPFNNRYAIELDCAYDRTGASRNRELCISFLYNTFSLDSASATDVAAPYTPTMTQSNIERQARVETIRSNHWLRGQLEMLYELGDRFARNSRLGSSLLPIRTSKDLPSEPAKVLHSDTMISALLLRSRIVLLECLAERFPDLAIIVKRPIFSPQILSEIRKTLPGFSTHDLPSLSRWRDEISSLRAPQRIELKNKIGKFVSSANGRGERIAIRAKECDPILDQINIKPLASHYGAINNIQVSCALLKLPVQGIGTITEVARILRSKHSPHDNSTPYINQIIADGEQQLRKFLLGCE